MEAEEEFKGLISISSLISELKLLIPDDHWNEPKDAYSLVKVAADQYVGRTYPDNWMCLMIKLIPVDDGFIDVPDNLKRIVRVEGSSDYVCDSSLTYREEVVAWVTKDVDDCMYSVVKDCPACHNEPFCDHPIMMNLSNYQSYLRSGSEKVLIKSYYGYDTDKDGNCCSYLNRDFKLMEPTLAKNFGLRNSDIDEMVGHGNNYAKGGMYEYRYHKAKKKMEVGFKEGYVLFTYMGYAVDSEGLRLLPDIPSYIEAVKQKMIVTLYSYLAKVNPSFYVSTYNREQAVMYGLHKEALSALSDLDMGKILKILDSARIRLNLFRRHDDRIGLNLLDNPAKRFL